MFKQKLTNFHTSTIHNSQKVETIQIDKQNDNELINKMYYIHIMKYYSTMKKKGLMHVIKWMNLENICYVKEDRHEMSHIVISFMWNIQNRKIHGERKWINGCQKLGGGKDRDWCLIGMQFALEVIKMFCNSTVVMFAHCDCTKCH